MFSVSLFLWVCERGQRDFSLFNLCNYGNLLLALDILIPLIHRPFLKVEVCLSCDIIVKYFKLVISTTLNLQECASKLWESERWLCLKCCWHYDSLSKTFSQSERCVEHQRGIIISSAHLVIQMIFISLIILDLAYFLSLLPLASGQYILKYTVHHSMFKSRGHTTFFYTPRGNSSHLLTLSITVVAWFQGDRM